MTSPLRFQATDLRLFVNSVSFDIPFHIITVCCMRIYRIYIIEPPSDHPTKHLQLVQAGTTSSAFDQDPCHVSQFLLYF